MRINAEPRPLKNASITFIADRNAKYRMKGGNLAFVCVCVWPAHHRLKVDEKDTTGQLVRDWHDWLA